MKAVSNLLYQTAAMIPEEVGLFLVHLCETDCVQAAKHIPVIVDYVLKDKVHKNNFQIVVKYIKKVGADPLDTKVSNSTLSLL